MTDTTLRDAIEELIWENVLVDDHCLGGVEEAADAIIAKLPEMIPDLVWDNGKCVGEVIHHHSKNQPQIVIYNWRGAKSWRRNYFEFGGQAYDTMQKAMSAANAHYKAGLMKQLGVPQTNPDPA